MQLKIVNCSKVINKAFYKQGIGRSAPLFRINLKIKSISETKIKIYFGLCRFQNLEKNT
jgi:hypothetical protein